MCSDWGLLAKWSWRQELNRRETSYLIDIWLPLLGSELEAEAKRIYREAGSH